MEENILLLKCKSIDELIFLYDLKEDKDYTIIKQNDVEAYNINLTSSDNAKVMIEVIKDVNIYIPHVKIYLSDFIFFKSIPTKAMLEYINYFSSDNLFLPYLTKERTSKAEIKHSERFKHLKYMINKK